MAFKVGETFTLSLSGMIAGTVYSRFAGGVKNEVAFNVSAFGSFGFDGGISLNGSVTEWGVGVSAPGTSAVEGYNTAVPLLNTTTPDHHLTPLDIGGSFTCTGTAQVWGEYAIDHPDSTSGDASYGVFQGPSTATLRLYLLWEEGSTVTASISSGGASASVTVPAPADEPTQQVFITGQAWNSDVLIHWNGPGPDFEDFYNQEDYPMDLSITLSSQGIDFAAGGLTASDSHGTASNGAGVEVHLVAPIPATPSDSYHSAGYASAASRTAPPHAFVMPLAIKALEQSYPGTVDVVLSKFLGDPAPLTSCGDGASLGYSQRYYSLDVQIGLQESSIDTHYTDTLNEWQGLSPSVSGDWCLANGEYVDYSFSDGSGGSVSRTFSDSLIQMHGWIMPGVSLSQAASYLVDDCTSLTNWTGAALATGGLKNSGTAAMARAFPSPGFDFSGYRYLRLHNASVATGASTVTLSLGGKTYTAPVTTTPADITFDLCDPVGGVDIDAYDSKWPLDSTWRNVRSSNLSGVSVASSLSLSVPSGVTLTVQGINQVRQSSPVAYFVSEWAPRATEDQPEETPPVPFGTDGAGTSTAYAHRGLVCDTDGKPSLEYRDIYTLHNESPSGTGDSWEQTYEPLSEMVSTINTNYGAGTGSCGWTASTSAPAADGTDSLRNGFLNQDTEGSALWACYGWNYSDGAWQHGIGVNLPGGMPSQLLFTTLSEWPALIGDVFGVGASGEEGADKAIILPASRVYRAQARAMVLFNDHSGPASGKTVILYPGALELQPAGTGVGMGTTDSRGYARTSGAGLDGYTTTSGATSGSGGNVTDTSDG